MSLDGTCVTIALVGLNQPWLERNHSSKSQRGGEYLRCSVIPTRKKSYRNSWTSGLSQNLVKEIVWQALCLHLLVAPSEWNTKDRGSTSSESYNKQGGQGVDPASASVGLVSQTFGNQKAPKSSKNRMPKCFPGGGRPPDNSALFEMMNPRS